MANINLLPIRQIAKEKDIQIQDIATYCGVTPQGLQKNIRENEMKISVFFKMCEFIAEPIETFVSLSLINIENTVINENKYEVHNNINTSNEVKEPIENYQKQTFMDLKERISHLENMVDMQNRMLKRLENEVDRLGSSMTNDPLKKKEANAG